MRWLLTLYRLTWYFPLVLGTLLHGYELRVFALCPVYQIFTVSWIWVAQSPRTVLSNREHFASAPP